MPRGNFLGLNDEDIGPTRSQLKALFTKHTVSQIAAMYKVSADAVRGWCAVFHMPARRAKPEETPPPLQPKRRRPVQPNRL